MKLKLFSIRDNKLSTFRRPFLFITAIEAQRAFAPVVMDQNSELFKNPEDFELFEIGEFDDVSGIITQSTHHKFITSAKTLMMQELQRQEKLKDYFVSQQKIQSAKAEKTASEQSENNS